MSGFGGRGGGGGFGGGRGGDYGGGDEATTTVDMYVRAEDCGRIIGRGGATIRDLQDRTQCRIKVSRDDEGDGTRRVELSGSDRQIEDAKEQIQRTIENDSRGGYGGGGGGYGGGRGGGYGGGRGFGGGGGGYRDQDRSNDPKEVMQIDASFVGRIIGKGGSRVRELQDDTGCRINVSRDSRGATTDVELVGTESQIRAARDAINDITSQVY